MHIFFTKRLTKEVFILLGICLIFFLLRIPSLYEPYWYGDEGIYFTVGKAIGAGRELYTQIWDNKPPILYWLYFFFNDIFRIRFLSLVFGLASVVVFFLLSRVMFRKSKIAFFTTTLYAVYFGLPTLEGNIANAENFMLLPIITAALFLWLSVDKKSRHILQQSSLLLFSGVLLGVSFLLKTVAVFDFAAFLFFVFALETEKNISAKAITSFISTYAPFLLGFVLPIMSLSIYFFLNGSLPEFLDTLFLRNATYVGENNDFLIPQGFLLMKVGLLLLSLLLIFRNRKTLSLQTMFVSLWLVFSLFNAFFSQRPYVHYQLVLLPSLALAAGLILSYSSLTKKIIAFAPLVGILLLLYQSFPHWHVNDAPQYYQNFISYVSGKKSAVAYRNFFDRNTPRDYAVAEYLKRNAKKNEPIFLWGDSAQIYYLSDTLPVGRYAVSYHIITPETIAETEAVFVTNPPRFLVVMPTSQPLPFTIHNYTYKLTIKDTAIYERTD
jgi:hypothetical protein